MEPREGQIDIVSIKKFIEYWKMNNCRVAFRIITSNIRGTQTPDYVFHKGVSSVIHKPNGKIQIDPVYWQSLYIELFSKFIRALGSQLNGGEGVEFIDIGGIGVFGEMHLGLHIPGMWTKEELIEHDFSEQKYFASYKMLIQEYIAAFPKTRLFLNISRYPQMAAYAADKKVGLRFDGLSIKQNPTQNLVSEAFQQFSVNANINLLGVPCMYEFANKESELEVIVKCLNMAFADPISYLHINLGKSNQLKFGVVQTLERYSKKIGYRFHLRRISVPSKISLGETIVLQQEWINKGIANAYHNYSFRYSITRGDQNCYTINLNPGTPTSFWKPNELSSFANNFIIPAFLSNGNYTLCLEMINNETGIPIKIDNKEINDSGVLKLFSFDVISKDVFLKKTK